MKRILLGAFLALCASFAYAQNPVITQPYGATSKISSAAIAVTNTFQSIWAASTATTGRVSCAVQNNGTHTMYVYFGPIANAITPDSIQLSAGQSLNCNAGGVILKDQVSITGTSGDRFFAAQQ